MCGISPSSQPGSFCNLGKKYPRAAPKTNPIPAVHGTRRMIVVTSRAFCRNPSAYGMSIAADKPPASSNGASIGLLSWGIRNGVLQFGQGNVYLRMYALGTSRPQTGHLGFRTSRSLSARWQHATANGYRLLKIADTAAPAAPHQLVLAEGGEAKPWAKSAAQPNAPG